MRLILIWLAGSLGVTTIQSAPTFESGLKSLEDAPIGQISNTNQLENDLTIGKSPSDNLDFKPTTDYQLRQNAEAIEKLQSIRSAPGGTNQLIEIANILREIVASDVSHEIKGDLRRLALLQLADLAEESGQLEQAQQLFAEYVERFSTDLIIPEVFLRQAYVFRKMGAFEMAISKLYLVMTSSLRLEAQNLSYYKRVVLTAQSEMAETYFQQEKYKDSAEIYLRLLRSDSEELNRVVVKVKLIRAYARDGNHHEVIKHANDLMNSNPGTDYQAEIRYLLASAYKSLGQSQEALSQFLLMLEGIEVAPPVVAANWKRWKMLAGNEIGNQLFLEGDYTSAVTVYQGLVDIDESPAWKLPIHYQVGLCFERLSAPQKAIEAYAEIIKIGNTVATPLEPSVQMVVDMARFRHEILSWKQSIERVAQAAAGPEVAEKTN